MRTECKAGWLPVVGGPLDGCLFYPGTDHEAGARVRLSKLAHWLGPLRGGYYCVGLNRDRIEWNRLDPPRN